MPDDEANRDVDTWLTAVYARWCDIGVPAVERVRLRRELERDISDAMDTGAGLADLISTDPAEFADRVATANGYGVPAPEQAHLSPTRIATTAVAGAVIGAAVVWFVIWPYLIQIAATASDGALIGLGYSIGAVVVLGGAAVALRLRLGRRTFRTEVGPALLGMVGGCLLRLAPALAISRALAYPTQPVLVLIEAVPLLGLALAGIIIVRHFVSSHVAPSGGPSTTR